MKSLGSLQEVSRKSPGSLQEVSYELFEVSKHISLCLFLEQWTANIITMQDDTHVVTPKAWSCSPQHPPAGNGGFHNQLSTTTAEYFSAVIIR